VANIFSLACHVKLDFVVS